MWCLGDGRGGSGWRVGLRVIEGDNGMVGDGRG